MSMPECGDFGVPLYTRWLPKRPLMRPCSGHASTCANPVRGSSRSRAAATRACSRSMRSAIAFGGSTVAGGTPSIRSTGQSRGVIAMRCSTQPVAGCLIRSTASPVASRPMPNTKLP